MAKCCSHRSDAHVIQLNGVEKYRWALQLNFKYGGGWVLSYLVYLLQSNTMVYNCVCHATDMHLACKGVLCCPCTWSFGHVMGWYSEPHTMHSAQCTMHIRKTSECYIMIVSLYIKLCVIYNCDVKYKTNE